MIRPADQEALRSYNLASTFRASWESIGFEEVKASPTGSMSDLKVFSLRKKHGRRIAPKESAQDAPAVPDDRSRHALQEKHGANGNSEPRSAPRSRSRPGGKTSDFVKKRYSVRYAQAPDLSHGDAPPMPGMPKLPSGYGQQRSRDPSPAQRAADLGILNDSSLQADDGRWSIALSPVLQC